MGLPKETKSSTSNNRFFRVTTLVVLGAILIGCTPSGTANSSETPYESPTPTPTPTPPLTGTVAISLPGDPSCAASPQLEVPKALPNPAATTTATLGEGLLPEKATVTLYEGETEIGSYPLDAVAPVPLLGTLNLKAVLMYDGKPLAEVTCQKTITLVDPSGKQDSFDVNVNPLIKISGNQLTFIRNNFYQDSGNYSIVIPTNVIHGVSGNNFPGVTLTVGIVGIATLNSSNDGGGDGGGGGGGGGG